MVQLMSFYSYLHHSNQELVKVTKYLHHYRELSLSTEISIFSVVNIQRNMYSNVYRLDHIMLSNTLFSNTIY